MTLRDPQPEKRQVRVSSGSLPSSRITSLSSCHPFTQQIDVVFPSNPALLDVLDKLETTFGKAKVGLVDVVKDCEANSNLLLLSRSQHEDDVWCIDPRAHLTICASKNTYERLGLVGQKLPFKSHAERHLIDIPLKRNAHSPKNLNKVKSALSKWDERRQVELGNDRALWDVVYCSRDPSAPVQLPCQSQERRIVQCRKREMYNVHTPHISSFDRPLENSQDAVDDWSRQIQSLFEWIGMASLGAQRLHANDRVDPFVAIYEPPKPSYVGQITHLQWKGLLSSAFVQRILDVVVASLNTTPAPPFIGITAHALTNSPVSYISYKTTESGELSFSDAARVAMKLPREHGEDAWSLLITKSGPNSQLSDDDVKWCLMESLGQYDHRWG